MGGPYKVLEVPSELHVVVGMADQTALTKLLCGLEKMQR